MTESLDEFAARLAREAGLHIPGMTIGDVLNSKCNNKTTTMPNKPFTPLVIDDKFEEYMRHVYPTVTAESRQYQDCRAIWYAATMTLFIHMVHSITNLTEEEATEQLNKLDDQLAEHIRQYRKFHGV
jgi:hypothetical protein